MPHSTSPDEEREAYTDGDAATNGCKTLWLGDVQPDWTEDYVESLFSSVGQDIEVKLIRDRQRGVVAGYGFVDFRSHEIAQLVLDTLNGKPIEGTSLRYRLNWGAGGKRIEQAPEFSLFVGDLSPEVTDAELKQTFLNKFPSVLGAKVVTNPMTGSSKSFGFIRFSDERERDKALTVMNGAECCGRPIRVAPATKRSVVPGPAGVHSTDPSNTTVFVGGVNETVTEKVLRETFSCAGEILTVTIPSGRGCAFITFAHRSSAEHVIYNMQGTTVCGSCLRLSWGKSGRADRDRDRERAMEMLGGMGGALQSPNAAAAAAAAAAARGAQYSGLYGHPSSYASYNGYPTNLFPTVFGNAYGAQQPGLPGNPASQLPQAQRQQQQQQQQQAQQTGQPGQQAQQQYPQTYSPQSYSPYQGFGFQQYPGQAYTNFGGANATYADPNTLAADLPQLSLVGGGGGTVGVGSIAGPGSRAARLANLRGIYGPARAGHAPYPAPQDIRKPGAGTASRN